MEHTHCLLCGRKLHSIRSRMLGYGPTCAARVRRAAVKLAGNYRTHQVESAQELIEDGAIVHVRSVAFRAVSSDGTETYLTSPHACACPAGLKDRRCYHQLAARILLAS